ncbi:MAG: hypothetical protein JAZ15_21875 [Candidatus Thiodiazotropha endolucinida]|nr:hypothetical protein [Candidatus Thiodiazotropha taylori]MCW4315667.1 hypothetical protein [Candidatus Thiodiazotropha taylori]
MSPRALLRIPCLVLIIFISISESWSDTFYTSPYKIYSNASGTIKMESLEALIENANTASQQRFSDCMAAEQASTYDDYWYCDKHTITNTAPYPILNNIFINNEPRVRELGPVNTNFVKIIG